MKKRLLIVTWTVCCACSLSVGASEIQDVANEPLVTDRPDFTESAMTVPDGRVQVETGFTVERNGDERSWGSDETLIRIGLGDHSELRVWVPSYQRVRVHDTKVSGLDDAFIGAKFVLHQSHKREPQVALLLGSTLPTGSRRIAERKFQPEAVIALGVPLSEELSLGLNAGAARSISEGSRFTQLFGSASLGMALRDKVGAFIETYIFNRTEAGGRGRIFCDAGVTYLLHHDLQLDARIGKGKGRNTTFYGVGISRRF